MNASLAGARATKNKIASQCDFHHFCVTGGLEIRLQEATAQYTADVRGPVLFGWDDESTGATIQEGGPNDGTWHLPPAVYEKDTGPIGLRATFAGFPAALECTMGVSCLDPVLGVGCSDTGLSNRIPDSELISFQIEAGAF